MLCETVWVLDSGYGFSRQEIADVLGSVMRARQLALGSADQVALAIEAFAVGKGDFADYLIREQALASGCSEVATFDRALLCEAGFISP